MELIQTVRKALALLAEGGSQTPWFQPDGSQVVYGSPGWVLAMQNAGYAYIANAGAQSTPITFAGAFDATAPDAYFYVPNGVTILPYEIEVIYEAVGTESTMEIMALASPEGDSSATGTAATVANKRVGHSNDHGLTVTGAIDAAGITDPNVTGAFTFWRKQRPLTDTVATGENDRNELNWRYSYKDDGPPPLIIGSAAGTLGSAAAGASLSVYAASQAGTGFIICEALVFPPTVAELLFGATP